MSRNSVALVCAAAAAVVTVVVVVGSRAAPPSSRPPMSADELCRAAMLTAEDGEGWVELKSAGEAWIGGAAMSDKAPLAQYTQEMLVDKVHATIGYAVYEDSDSAEAALQLFAKAQADAKYRRGAVIGSVMGSQPYLAHTTLTAGDNLWTSRSGENNHPRVLVRFDSLFVALSFEGSDPCAPGVMEALNRAAEVIADKHRFLAIPDIFRGILFERGENPQVEALSVLRTNHPRAGTGEGEKTTIVPRYDETVRFHGVTIWMSCSLYESGSQASQFMEKYRHSTSVGWDRGLWGQGVEGRCPGEECWYSGDVRTPGMLFRTGAMAVMMDVLVPDPPPVEVQQEAIHELARLVAERIRSKGQQ